MLHTEKGKKFQKDGITFWHNIDRMGDEGEICTKMSMAARELRSFAAENCICSSEEAIKVVNGDWNIGYMFLNLSDERPKKLFVRSRETKEFIVSEGAAVAVPGFDFQELIGRVNSPNQ